MMGCSDSEAGELTVHGVVKWFDPLRGFGFLTDDAGGKDVLIHANVLRRFGQGSVSEGARMSVVAIAGTRGRQASAILSLVPPVDEGKTAIADLDCLTPQQRAALPLWPARVKWFDKAKGFGFANLFGQTGDVFLHVEVLRQSGLADLAAGEAVALRVFPGPRGPMAAQIASWDSAVQLTDGAICPWGDTTSDWGGQTDGEADAVSLRVRMAGA